MTTGTMTNRAAADDSPFRDPAAPAKTHPWLDRLDSALERAADWLNPILIKEARQALKSRQFVVTFCLLLLFGWVWSVAGVAALSPGISFAPGGRVMLIGYTLILLIPMLVVVPFSAFRSLAAEREDGTFELLSITALNSRQIVTGKLGSAVLQMMVYYSALAPCIAFTFLLRGVDVLVIFLLLVYILMASVLLSSLGLLVATISRSRHWQVLLSVCLVIALMVVDIFGSFWSVMLISATGSVEFEDPYFWLANFAVLTFYVSYVMLFVLGAAAQISFASDNRSTKLRVVLLVQQMLWVFWMMYLALASEDDDILYGVMPFAALQWLIAAALMSGESPQLSPRVRRSLPQSFLGRTLFTWFNPGSGTGYVFCVVNMWVLACVIVVGTLAVDLFSSMRNLSHLITFTLVIAAYFTVYTGVARLIVLTFRRWIFTGLIVPVMLHAAMVALGAIVPLLLAGWIRGFSQVDYSELQLTNWAWTMAEAAEGNLWNYPFVPVTLFVTAVGMLVLHLKLAMSEVEQTRLQTPTRVIEDELLLHPERVQPARKASPWD